MKEVIVITEEERYGVPVVGIEAVGYGWVSEKDVLEVAKQIVSKFRPDMSEKEVFEMIEEVV